jgi:hypothetical protein
MDMKQLMDDLNAELEVDFPEIKGLRMTMERPHRPIEERPLSAAAAVGMAISGLYKLENEVRDLQRDLCGLMADDDEPAPIGDQPIMPVFDTLRAQAKELATLIGRIHRRVEFIRRRT